jgi:hypothetical protein
MAVKFWSLKKYNIAIGFLKIINQPGMAKLAKWSDLILVFQYALN